MSGYSSWPATVAGSVVGGLTLALLVWGLVRKPKSTNQLRWVIGFLAGFAVAVGYGAIALDQGYSTTPKMSYWGNHIVVGISSVALVTVTCLGIFSDFGARLATPVLALLGFAAYVFGSRVLNAGFGMTLWYMCGTMAVVFAGALIFLVDHLDVISSLPTRNREPIGKFPGLLWRILCVIPLVYNIIFAALASDFYGVLSATGQQISDAFVVIAMFIIIFVNWIVVEGAEPAYDGTFTTGPRDRESVAYEQRGLSKSAHNGRV